MVETKKIALITGATSGIGESTSYELANQFSLILCGRNTDKLKELEASLSTKTKVKTLQFDVRNQQDVYEKISSLGNDWKNIDVLINNAGITKDNLLMRMGEDDFDQVIEVNLKSVFNMTKAVQRTMLKQRKGSIINMSSIVGVKGNAGQTNYAASKAGIIGFSKSVALELGSRDIRSNVIAPGFIETEMTGKLDEQTVQSWRDAIPLKRGGTPLDIANACVFLASDLSSYVTGQVINVDGGMLT